MILETLNLLLWGVLLHEIGHLFFFRLKGLKPDIRIIQDPFRIVIGCPLDYKYLTKKDNLILNAFGVVFGLIPSLFATNWYSMIIFLTLYLYGSMNDLKRIYKNVG